jgi:hypothetical protein
MRNLLSRQRGKPPWKPSGRPFVMPAMPPAKLGSEKADRSSVDRWTEDCRPDLPVKVTRHESRRPGTASVAITNYIDLIPETNEPELGRLSIGSKGVWKNRLRYTGDFEPEQFVADSPVEESGFEPSVPPVNELVSPAGTRMRTRRYGRSRGVVYVAGTKGSNPLSSSGESASSSGPRRRASRLRRSNGGGPQVTRRRGSVTSDRSGAAIICNIIFA